MSLKLDHSAAFMCITVFKNYKESRKEHYET